jgi:hypothetical protein
MCGALEQGNLPNQSGASRNVSANSRRTGIRAQVPEVRTSPQNKTPRNINRNPNESFMDAYGATVYSAFRAESTATGSWSAACASVTAAANDALVSAKATTSVRNNMSVSKPPSKMYRI